MSDPNHEYLATLLAETREELNRADNKASIMLAATGVAAGVLIANAANGSWAPNALPLSAGILWWGASVVGVAAILCFGRAVFPAIHRKGDGSAGVMYYGDVVESRTAEELAERISDSSSNSLHRETDQLLVISGIVVAKYNCIRWGMLLAGIALLSFVLAVAFS
jgi:hypothetical protein